MCPSGLPVSAWILKRKAGHVVLERWHVQLVRSFETRLPVGITKHKSATTSTRMKTGARAFRRVRRRRTQKRLRRQNQVVALAVAEKVFRNVDGWTVADFGQVRIMKVERQVIVACCVKQHRCDVKRVFFEPRSDVAKKKDVGL